MATNEQVIAWLTANPTATDAEITAIANATGVSAAQLAAVTGLPVADVSSRMGIAPAAQTSAPVTAAPANQGLAENATMAGGLLDQYKAYLKPAEYEQLIAPLMFTANENFGGKVQDYQVQLLTPLDTSKVGLPKQLDMTPATTKVVSGGWDNPDYVVEVPAQLKSTGFIPIGGGDYDGGSTPITGYRSTTPVMVNGVPVFGNYDAAGKLTGYEGDDRVTTWTDGNNRLIGNWDASGKAAPRSSESQTGMFNTGFHWNDLRDNLEAAAVIAGNYVLPGSSLLTSRLVTEGAQENLNTDAGRLANMVAGASGGQAGNMGNYGKIGDAVGLTGAPTEAGAVPSGAESVPSVTPPVTPPSGGTSLLDYSMPSANGGLGLQATPALDGTLSSGLAAPAGGSLGGGLGLTASAAGNLTSMGGAQGLTANAAGGGTLSAGGVNTGLFTPENLYQGTGSITNTGGGGGGGGTNLTPAQVIKAIPLVTTVNALVGDPLGIQPKVPTTIPTPTGFGIVPIPEGWRSPTYSQGAQTPIDLNSIFSNQNLLIGTQWEGLPNQRNLTFNDIFAAGKQSTPMGNPVNLNNLVSAILGQTATSQKST